MANRTIVPGIPEYGKEGRDTPYCDYCLGVNFWDYLYVCSYHRNLMEKGVELKREPSLNPGSPSGFLWFMAEIQKIEMGFYDEPKEKS